MKTLHYFRFLCLNCQSSVAITSEDHKPTVWCRKCHNTMVEEKIQQKGSNKQKKGVRK